MSILIDSAVTNHALIRASQRYGVAPGDPLPGVLLEKIRLGKRSSMQFYHKKARAYVYKVRHGRKLFRIVVNRELTKIITFLPPKETTLTEGDFHGAN